MKVSTFVSSRDITIPLVALIAILVMGGIVSAWTGPPGTPPSPNASAPLNVSSTAQSKSGGLLLNTGGAANGLIVSSGNVGIGETSPQEMLHLTGGAPRIALEDDEGAVNTQDTWEIGTNIYAGGAWNWGDFGIWNQDDDTGIFIENETGDVGIGTASPGQKLDVSGNIRQSGGHFIFGSSVGIINVADTGALYLRTAAQGATTPYTNRMIISSDGVGIGAGPSASYQLYVNGAGGGAQQNYTTNGYAFYGVSNSSYAIFGKSTASNRGGVIGYNSDNSAYGILGYGSDYSLFGNSKVRGGQLCIGNDCRSSWPSSGGSCSVTGRTNCAWTGGSTACPSPKIMMGSRGIVGTTVHDLYCCEPVISCS